MSLSLPLSELVSHFSFSASTLSFLVPFLKDYEKVLDSIGAQPDLSLLSHFFQEIRSQIAQPYLFPSLSKRLKEPIDYQKMGIELLTPLVDIPSSSIEGLSFWKEIATRTKEGENVILLSNHQIEPDPHILQLLLSAHDPEIIQEAFFVAGERVLVDPLATFFSKGVNLFSVYSKRHISRDLDLESKRKAHNLSTIRAIESSLNQGGHLIWVAVSGGRDRLGPDGYVSISPVDSSSLELFLLLQKRSKIKTSTYPLALSTYSLLPPPEAIQLEIGEIRRAQRAPVRIKFFEEFRPKESSFLAEELHRILQTGYVPILPYS